MKPCAEYVPLCTRYLGVVVHIGAVPEHRTWVLPLFVVPRPGHLYTNTIKMLCSYWCPCLNTVREYSVWTLYNKLYKQNQTNFGYWMITDKTVKNNFANNNPILRLLFCPSLFKPLRGPGICLSHAQLHHWLTIFYSRENM